MEQIRTGGIGLCVVAVLSVLGCYQQNTSDGDLDEYTEVEPYLEDVTETTIEPPYVEEAYVTIEPPPAYDPVGPQAPSSEEWREIAGREAFERKKPFEPTEPIEPNITDQQAENFFDSLSTVAWGLVIALLAAGLAYAIYRQRRKPDLSVSRGNYSATDALLNTAPDALAADLASKLDDRDWRTAIRLRFGQVLQDLRTRKLLVWVPGSTNLEYERALPPYLQHDFAALATDFNYATYAGRQLDERRFDRFAERATAFLLIAYGPNDPRRATSPATKTSGV